MSMNFEVLRQAGKEAELFRVGGAALGHEIQVISPARGAREAEFFPEPPASPGMRRAAFFVVMLLGMGISLYVYERRTPLSQAQQQRTVEGTVFEGVIRPAHEIKVASPVAGVVTKVMAKVGEQVEEGQPLLVLENAELENEVAEAKLERDTTAQQIAQLERTLADPDQSLLTRLAEANGRVSVLERRAQQVPTPERRESPERARAAYERAQAAFRRAELLQKEGLTSEQQYEDSRASLQIAEDDLNVALKAEVAEEALAREQESQARLQVQVSRRQQTQQLQELRLRYQKAAQAFETAQQRESQGLVKATSAGVLVELPIKPGDQVASGTMLARVGRLDLMVVEVEVAARLVNALHPKQRALVALPTVPPQQVEGEIATIGPVPVANMNHIVEVEFRNPAETLWADQPAQVRFLPQ